MLKGFVSIVAIVFSVSAFSVEISLQAEDNFVLSADFVETQTGSKNAVLMLHQCNETKSMYHGLAEKLAAEGISSLALDFRGYGKSKTAEVDQTQIKKDQVGRESYIKKMRPIVEFWPSDVELAYKYLLKKVGEKGKIAVIGASCGGGQLVELAQSHEFSSFVFLSTGFDNRHGKMYHSLKSVPTLIIAAEGDSDTFNSANKMFEISENPYSRLMSYKGKYHGITLFELDKNLINVMVEWIGNNFHRK